VRRPPGAAIEILFRYPVVRAQSDNTRLWAGSAAGLPLLAHPRRGRLLGTPSQSATRVVPPCLRAQPRRRRRLHNGVRCAPTGCSLHHVTERMLLGCGRSVGPRHASRSENETPNCESITSPTSAPVAHTDPPSIHRSSAGRHFFHGVLQSYSASTQTRTGGVLWAVPSAAV